MQNTFKIVLILSSLFALLPNAHSSELHPVVSIGYDQGGDTLLNYTVSTINGRTLNLNDKITGGNGLTLSIGAYMPLGETFGLQGTVGLKIDSNSFVNNTYLAFSRTPYDLIGYYHMGQHHNLGIGATYHTGTSFSCTTDSTTQTGCNFTFDFDNAVGSVIEYNYAVSHNNDGGLKLGIRYTKIRYDLSNSNQSFDGSSFGIILYGY